MPMLDHLVNALVEARERAGASLEDVSYYGRVVSAQRGREVLIDRSFLSRLERGLAGWSPKIDDVVRAYAAACHTTDTALWTAALEEYGREEGRIATKRARRRGLERSGE
jgi:transcriptional regulator with XRE-family HTH domain